MTTQTPTERPALSGYTVSTRTAHTSARTVSRRDVNNPAAAAPTLSPATTRPKLNDESYPVSSNGAASGTHQFVIDDALVALRAAVQRDDESGWLKASRLLRRSAIEENSRSPRFATLALAISDALAFTSPDELDGAAKQPLVEAFELLREPFIPGDAEESVFQGLLDNGWRVTAPFDASEWADVAE